MNIRVGNHADKAMRFMEHFAFFIVFVEGYHYFALERSNFYILHRITRISAPLRLTYLSGIAIICQETGLLTQVGTFLL